MDQNKRKLVKGVVITAVWSTPIITAVRIPVHAQTSTSECAVFETESVDQPISITVSETDVRGPAVANRTGQTFAVTLDQSGATCADGVTVSMSSIEFSGTIDETTNSLSGTFNVMQYCGDQLACEQLATFTATQTPIDSTSDLGTYEGRVVGTLRCCSDLL